MKKVSQSILIFILCFSLISCTVNQVLDDINVAIQVAANIGTAVGAVSPADAFVIQNLSSIASGIMIVVQNAYNTYQKSGALTDLQKLEAAINVGKSNLNAALQAVHVTDPKTVAKVTAWGNLVISCLDAVISALPQGTTARMTQNRQFNINLYAKDIQTRWQNEVCKGDTKCGSLVKVPKHGLMKLVP